MIIASRLVLEPVAEVDRWPSDVVVPEAGWGMILASEGRLVGYISRSGSELGGEIFEADRGRGFGREAAAAVVEYLVVVEQVPRLVVRTAADALAAGKILLGLGFEPTREGEEYVWVFRVKSEESW